MAWIVWRFITYVHDHWQSRRVRHNAAKLLAVPVALIPTFTAGVTGSLVQPMIFHRELLPARPV
jgi:hypothetical protein